MRPAKRPGEYVVIGEYDILASEPAINYGQMVKVNASGALSLQTAVAGNLVLGTFSGCKYVDATGRPTVSKNWPGVVTGATNIVGYVEDVANLIYEVQADGPVTATKIGAQGLLTNDGVVNALGFPTAVLSTASLSHSVANQLMIVGLQRDTDNAWGDAFTKVLVKFSQTQMYGSVAPF